MAKKIFIIAGEHSGDSLGAGLIRALKAQSKEPLEISGIGGPLMEAEGFESLTPMDGLCVIGIWEIIWQLPRLIKMVKAVVFEIEKFNPDALVTIDLPDFNFHVASLLKKNGKCKAKRIHYVAPSVWAWRPGRAKEIAGFLHGLMCLLPFEPPYFTKHKLKAEYVGHPVVETVPAKFEPAEFRKSMGIKPDSLVLGLFFGSRESELKSMGRIILKSAFAIREQYPDVQIIVPTVPDLEYEVSKILERENFPAYLIKDPEKKWNAYASCDVAIAVSGTVGLELAYMGVPHVVLYKTHPVTAILLKFAVKIKYAHLANIILNELVVPEYLQGKCDSLEIAKGVLKLLKDEKARIDQKASVSKVKNSLLLKDGAKPSEKAAAFVLKAIKAA